jgi:hypothetical protein
MNEMQSASGWFYFALILSDFALACTSALSILTLFLLSLHVPSWGTSSLLWKAFGEAFAAYGFVPTAQ